MKRGVVFILLIIVLFLVSCQVKESPIKDATFVNDIVSESESVVCEAPYIRYGSECCLDQNGNKICDNDESVVEEIPEGNGLIAEEDIVAQEIVSTADEGITRIRAFPKEIKGGEKIYVEIFPGDRGAELEIEIQKKEKSYLNFKWEDGSQGFSRYKKDYPLNTSYKTSSDWNGEYIVKVKDIGTDENIEDNFFVFE